MFFFYFSGGVFDHLCVDTSRVCSFVSFELVHGIAELLHRERRHRVMWLVATVLVAVCLRRWRVELFVEIREHICNIPSVVLVVAPFVLHMCFEAFPASDVDGSRVF